MNRYEQGKIYEIVAPDGSRYIGSTIATLTCRFGNHRRLYKSWKEGKQRNTTVFKLFDTYGVENCKINLIENFPCNSKKELERREGEIIKITECVNEVIAGRTSEEYREDNRDVISQRFKEFYNKNKETEIERVKMYYSENKESVNERSKIYAQENSEKIRERKRVYNQENKDVIKEQKRKWRELNKDKINARKRELRRLNKETN